MNRGENLVNPEINRETGCAVAPQNLSSFDKFFFLVFKWAKCEMEETIDSEMSGDLRQGLQTLVKCIRNENQFLADKLHVVLHGKDTKTAARIILSEVSFKNCFSSSSCVSSCDQTLFYK